MMQEHAKEVQQGERFEFGKNWHQFLQLLTEERIAFAENSLRSMLGVESLTGKRFLDIGSGSGLFSLAARRLGAEVLSFDYDPKSVACTRFLKEHYFPNDSSWRVEEGSVLDPDYVARQGSFDVVYSWGVLHHTGQMWPALANAEGRVAEGGLLFIALYNDQGWKSRIWHRVKNLYNALPFGLKWCVLLPSFGRLWGPTLLKDLLRGNPLRTWRSYRNSSRGMDPWRDVVDWVGGYPFEVASPEVVFDYFKARGYSLEKLKTCSGGHGCNEFVFARNRSDSSQTNTKI